MFKGKNQQLTLKEDSSDDFNGNRQNDEDDCFIVNISKAPKESQAATIHSNNLNKNNQNDEDACCFSNTIKDSIEEDRFKCPTCLKKMEVYRIWSIKCGHCYCKICINNIIGKTQKCALCSKPYKTSDKRRILL